MNALSDQAVFWRGEFGDSYIDRNDSPHMVAANTALFADALSRGGELPKTALELGANIGQNYLALKHLMPGLEFTGVEVNEAAFKRLQKSGARAINSSIEDFESSDVFDLVFTKLVLIHLNPESLDRTYKKMGRLSSKFVFICEYFNPTPTQINYRGHNERLFKRDFCGEFLRVNPDFSLVAEGFASRRGVFPQDDVTWSLMRRR